MAMVEILPQKLKGGRSWKSITLVEGLFTRINEYLVQNGGVETTCQSERDRLLDCEIHIGILSVGGKFRPRQTFF